MADRELEPGARNAVRVCLRIEPTERVTVISDRSAAGIAASLMREIAAVGAPAQLFVLEDLATRPLTTLPEPVAVAMEQSQVSIFAGSAQPGELPFRMAMTDVVNRRRM